MCKFHLDPQYNIFHWGSNVLAVSTLCLICAWINGWANNPEAGDLRSHCAHYDVIIMLINHLMRSSGYQGTRDIIDRSRKRSDFWSPLSPLNISRSYDIWKHKDDKYWFTNIYRHHSDAIWATWRLKSRITRLFVQELVKTLNKANIKDSHYWPFVRLILSCGPLCSFIMEMFS